MKARNTTLVPVGLLGLALTCNGCGDSSNSPGGTSTGSAGGTGTTSGAGTTSGSGAGGTGENPTTGGSSGAGQGNDTTGSPGTTAGGGDTGSAGSGGSAGAGGDVGSAGAGGSTTPPADAGVVAQPDGGGNGGTGGPGNTCNTPVAKPTCNGNPAYVNPAKGQIGIHDPSVVREGCTFYAFATGGVLPGKTSTDLINWKAYSPPRFTLPAWTNGAQIWAPDVHYANGKFYNYYSLWHGAIPTAQVGLLTNTTLDDTSPNYKWEDQGLIVDVASGGGSGVNVIDPDFFIDDDGSWWLIYGSFNKGVRLIELNPGTGLPKDKPLNPTLITDHLGEGSSLFKNNGYYYVAVSRGKCCAGVSSAYEVIYARSTNVKGPYMTKSGQAFATSSYTDATDALLRVGQDNNPGGEGGQSFFQENGQWYIDYHTYNAGAQGLADLDVRPIYFDSSNWLTFDCTQSAH